jgi:hypothetical protein
VKVKELTGIITNTGETKNSPVSVTVPESSFTFTSVSYSTCKFFYFHQYQVQYLKVLLLSPVSVTVPESSLVKVKELTGTVTDIGGSQRTFRNCN